MPRVQAVVAGSPRPSTVQIRQIACVRLPLWSAARSDALHGNHRLRGGRAGQQRRGIEIDASLDRASAAGAWRGLLRGRRGTAGGDAFRLLSGGQAVDTVVLAWPVLCESGHGLSTAPDSASARVTSLQYCSPRRPALAPGPRGSPRRGASAPPAAWRRRPRPAGAPAWCGAPWAISGSSAASSRISRITSAKWSSRSLVSVSVGSIISASSTRSGKYTVGG